MITNTMSKPTTAEERRLDKLHMSPAEIDSMRIVTDMKVEPMEGAEEHLRAKATADKSSGLTS